jgi:diguanylate cyclase (GGDEF)-like protein
VLRTLVPSAAAERTEALFSRETVRLLPVFLPVTLAGFAAVAAAVVRLSQDPPSGAWLAGVGLLLVAAILAEAFPVPVESLPAGHLSLAAVFILGAAMIYGWPAAIVVGLLTRALLELLQRRPYVRLLYNSSLYALAAAAAGVAVGPFAAHEAVPTLVLEVLVGAAAFYLVNIPLVAAIMARWSRQPFLPLLRDSVVWTAGSFAIMASVSLALKALWTQSPALMAALAGPLVAVALYQRSTHETLRAMRLALTDPLTGLGNHGHFQDQLQLEVERAAVSDTPLSVCLLDLDNFKQINDRYGHPAGDRVLAETGARLRQSPGSAFRLGGDEFALVLPGHGETTAVEQAERLVGALAADGGGHGDAVTFSAGVATFPQHGRDPSELVRMADISLYWAKADGRNRVRLYQPDRPVVGHLHELASGFDRGARLGAASALVGALDARDACAGSHSERVGELAAACAARFELSPEQVELIRLAGRLHDLGKVAIPEEILHKPGPLTRRERLVIERHPRAGYEMLEGLEVEPVASWVLHHHERWDGDGYPSNLAGEQIPIGSRIILVADAYDAMLSDRVYRASMTPEAAVDELTRCAGSQFDPVVVEVFLEGLATERVPAPPPALAAAR